MHTHIPGHHNLFADALNRYHIPSHHAKFASLSKKLRNSYFSHQLPGDFIYFDVDWHFNFTRTFLLGFHAHVPSLVVYAVFSISP